MGIKFNFDAKQFERDLKKAVKENVEKQVLDKVKKTTKRTAGIKVKVSDDLKKITVTGVSQDIVNKALSENRT